MSDKSKTIIENEGDEKVDEAAVLRERAKTDKEMSQVAAELGGVELEISEAAAQAELTDANVG